MKGILFVGLALLSSVSFAIDGGVPIRLDGSDSTCINRQKHAISIHLRRFLVGKDVGWFKADKEAGILVNTTLSGQVLIDGKAVSETQSFPSMIKHDVQKYKKGIVSLPIEDRLFHELALSSSDREINSIKISYKILKKKKKANFGVALDHLSAISEGIPDTINPFSPAFKYFADYSSKVVDQSLNEENNVDEALSDADLSLSFSNRDACSGDNERTGVIAVIKNVDSKLKNEVDAIDISEIREYCLKASYRPNFAILYKRKVDGICSDEKDNSFKEIQNPYTLFVVNAAVVEKDGIASSSMSQKLLQESLNRCKLLNIDEKDCI